MKKFIPVLGSCPLSFQLGFQFSSHNENQLTHLHVRIRMRTNHENRFKLIHTYIHTYIDIYIYIFGEPNKFSHRT
jgi:hypothetical protein